MVGCGPIGDRSVNGSGSKTEYNVQLNTPTSYKLFSFRSMSRPSSFSLIKLLIRNMVMAYHITIIWVLFYRKNCDDCGKCTSYLAKNDEKCQAILENLTNLSRAQRHDFYIKFHSYVYLFPGNLDVRMYLTAQERYSL